MEKEFDPAELIRLAVECGIDPLAIKALCADTVKRYPQQSQAGCAGKVIEYVEWLEKEE